MMMTDEQSNLSLQNQSGENVHRILQRSTRIDATVEQFQIQSNQANGSSPSVLSKSAFQITSPEDAKNYQDITNGKAAYKPVVIRNDYFKRKTAIAITENLTAVDGILQQNPTGAGEANKVAEIRSTTDARANFQDSKDYGKLFVRKSEFEENKFAYINDHPVNQKTTDSIPKSPKATDATEKQDLKNTNATNNFSLDISLKTASCIVGASTSCQTLEIRRKQFSRQPSFEVNKRTLVGDEQFICEVCKETFSQVIHLIIHKRLHTGEEPYVCDLCCRVFTYMQSLNAHKRSHDDKPFACEECAMYFQNENNFTRHINRRKCNKSPSM